MFKEEISADTLTPITAFQALQGSIFLESGEGESLSLIGLRPLATFEGKGREFSIQYREGCEKGEGDLFEKLVSLQQKLSFASCMGHVSYDAVRLIEKIPDRHIKSFPDFFFQFFEVLVTFDRKKGKIAITVETENKEYAQSVFQEIKDKLKKPVSQPPFAKQLSLPIEVDMDDATFAELVKKAKEHIVAGDIFQIVLSRTFQRPVRVDPFTVYRALRLINPSPFMFYIRHGEYDILGASPERLVRVQEGIVETVPIAGTRRRGKNLEDAAIEQELLKDEKEDAEHMMLVDLGRNDIGKVTEIGSVEVKELKKVEKFSHVMHLTSRVTGRLKSSLSAIDALKSVFPAGTLSGAPKVRAMELIDSMETSRRGLYGGAICSLDQQGNLDSCIAMRFALVQEGVATVRTGAGIVFDSDPMKEAQETRDKAEALFEAIRYAEEEGI